MFLHLYEPHAPYEPPEPFKSLYANPYDGEIAAADAIVGRFLAFLKAKGLYDRALVVVFSDHGEGLGDHGESEHGVFLYREVLQVPLLVKLPKGSAPAPRSVAEPVQLTDVFTTVGEAAGLDGFTPPPGTKSLIAIADAAARPPRRIYAESYFPRTHFGWSELRSLLDGRWHYIEAPRPELFDLAADPAEKTNLAPGRPEPFRKLRIEMEALRASFAAPAAVDREAAKKLASLGYLSSGAAAGSGPLDDPKDHIATVGLMKEALRELVEGDPAKTVAITRALLAENPRMLDIWELQAQALARLGKTDEALASLRKTIELVSPGLDAIRRLVREPRARDGQGRGGPKSTPSSRGRWAIRRPMEILARACLALGDLPAAEAAARACLKTPRPDRDSGLLVLAAGRGAPRGPARRRSRPHRTSGKDAAHALSAPRPPPPARRRPRAHRPPRRGGGGVSEELRAYPTTLAAWTSLVILYASRTGRPTRGKRSRRWSPPRPASTPTSPRSGRCRSSATAPERNAGRREGLRKYPGETRFRLAPRAA